MTSKPSARGARAATSGRARHASQPPASPEPRQPQQERGQRRVEAILDATARIVDEEGVAAVTMQRVARLSGTTTGSMYHFFPDRETLLRALTERHARALRALLGQLEHDAAECWARLSTADAVDLFLRPFLGYVDQHPDLLPLARVARYADWSEQGRDAELDALVVRLANALVASRDPGASRAELGGRAAAVMALTEGVVSAMGRRGSSAHGALPIAVLRRELRRALVAYLDSFSPAPARARRPQARGPRASVTSSS